MAAYIAIAAFSVAATYAMRAEHPLPTLVCVFTAQFLSLVSIAWLIMAAFLMQDGANSPALNPLSVSLTCALLFGSSATIFYIALSPNANLITSILSLLATSFVMWFAFYLIVKVFTAIFSSVYD